MYMYVLNLYRNTKKITLGIIAKDTCKGVTEKVELFDKKELSFTTVD